jgi:hypothetical protein
MRGETGSLILKQLTNRKSANTCPNKTGNYKLTEHEIHLAKHLSPPTGITS